MCGICGQVGGALDIERLKVATELMRHRGPDQEGISHNSLAMFSHCRLSIIDLSEAGRQPMINEDGTILLVFNGEIYNFSEIRSLLDSKHCFQSRTDSEVLVHGYEEWGIEGLLQRIRGMFAFALWDEQRRTLHIARDHVGKKPLFYSILGGGIKFASTLPALLALIGTTPSVSKQAVRDYLMYKCIPAPETIFNGIFKLLPAHRLEFSFGGSCKISNYWRPNFLRKDVYSESEWLEQIDATLRKSVAERLIADVPLGAFLSGGVDSSLVVALMAELSSQRIATFSMGFKDAAFDELPFARQVAQAYETDHHEFVLEPAVIEILPTLIFQFGEPFADVAALPTFLLSQAAHKYTTVVLTGDGGDECFAGYPSVIAAAAAQRLHGLPGMSSGRVSSMLEKLTRNAPQLISGMRWIAEIAAGPDGNYVFDPVGHSSFREQDNAVYGPLLLDGNYVDRDLLYHQLWTEACELDWADRALYVDLLTILPNDFLVKTDVTMMAFGLEGRSPFLDLRLVELAARIPAQQKIKGWNTKLLLKKLAERYLPRECHDRPKHGFLVPTSQWLRQDLGKFLRPILLSATTAQRDWISQDFVARLVHEHMTCKANHGQRLWSLMVLELWMRMFIEKSLRPEDSLSQLV